jgi:hypothetical protein
MSPVGLFWTTMTPLMVVFPRNSIELGVWTYRTPLMVISEVNLGFVPAGMIALLRTLPDPV